MDETKLFNDILDLEHKADGIDQESHDEVLRIKEEGKKAIEKHKKELSDTYSKYLEVKKKDLDSYLEESRLKTDKKIKEEESNIIIKKEKIFPEIINIFINNLFKNNVS